MSHGGKRAGAGRPKGAKTKRHSEIARKAAAEGLTPLEFMLKILRDEGASYDERKWAAEKSAPYIHARLNSVDMTARVTTEDLTDEQLDRAIAEKQRQAGMSVH